MENRKSRLNIQICDELEFIQLKSLEIRHYGKLKCDELEFDQSKFDFLVSVECNWNFSRKWISKNWGAPERIRSDNGTIEKGITRDRRLHEWHAWRMKTFLAHHIHPHHHPTEEEKKNNDKSRIEEWKNNALTHSMDAALKFVEWVNWSRKTDRTTNHNPNH